jgi:hypothetical protein
MKKITIKLEGTTAHTRGVQGYIAQYVQDALHKFDPAIPEQSFTVTISAPLAGGWHAQMKADNGN